MTTTPPNPLPDADPAASGLYLRLWQAGFRWLYVLDAIGILAVAALVGGQGPRSSTAPYSSS